MGFWQSEALSVAPKQIWLLMCLGIVLAADIAAALSLVFAATILPLSFDGPEYLLLVLGLIFFLAVVPVAGLLVGLPMWWLFVARPGHVTRRRGILLGMLSGLGAHPLVWMGCLLLLSPLNVISPMPDLTSNSPMGLSADLSWVFPLSVMSLILVGWITAAVGGIAGGLLVHLQVALMRRMRGRQQDGIESPRADGD